MTKAYISEAFISPAKIRAGDSAEINIRLILGPDFHPAGSRIILDLPAYLGYSRPTRRHQEDDGYIEVLCSNPDLYFTGRVWDVEAMDFAANLRNPGFKGMAQRLFVIDFPEGDARAGDELLIKWGYTQNGFGIGTRVTTLVLKKKFLNTVHVRYFADGSKGLPDLGRSFKGYERPVPDVEIPLSFQIVPREPERIRVIRKSSKTSVLITDRFSNICNVRDIDRYVFHDQEGRFNSFGVYEIPDPSAYIAGKGLEVSDTPDMSDVYNGRSIYFGDLHLHSGVSCDCIEREKSGYTAEDLYRYARDVQCLDFLAVTDHHEPFSSEREKIGKENWQKLLEAAGKYTRDNEFLAFPGFEFTCDRGDAAIVLNGDIEYGIIDDPGLKCITDLWRRLEGVDYISIPHFSSPGSLGEGEWIVCPYEGVEPVVEIFSCYGSFESDDVFERRIADASVLRRDRNGRYFLGRGYHYGFICNSDSHKGNPGSNGLTAVYAESLTKDAVFKAIRSRNVYGTTNARIRLLFEINGNLMGAVLPNTVRKTIHIAAAGEKPFKCIDIFKDGKPYKRFKPCTLQFETEFEAISDEASNWYIRATQLDNHIAYSSPIWFV